MSIARRFTLYTLFIVFLLASIITPIEIVSAYRKESDRISQEIHQIEQTHIPSIVSSLWLTHYELLQQQVESIVQFPYIDEVRVVEEGGGVFIGRSPDFTEEDITNPEIFMVHEENLTYNFKGETVLLGQLRMLINTGRLKADIFSNRIPFILFQLISAVIVAFSISVLFHRMVGRHLLEFADFLRSDTEDSLAVPFSIPRRRKLEDELNYLAESVNSLRSRLHDRFRKKDLLLREVHHRIKNNMATVSGLLNLQASACSNDQASRILTEAVNRIGSMTLLYEKLYKEGAIKAMAVADFLNPLIEQIIEVNRLGNKIRFETNFDDIFIDPQTLSILGILLNELISNSLKHAFPHGNGGKICIDISRNDETRVELHYRDNGIGIPDSVLSGRNTGLGMALIQSLSEQLEGSLVFRGGEGTSVIITFPGKPADSSA